MKLQKPFIHAILISGFAVASIAQLQIASASDVTYIEGSTQKTCQLTGDIDRERGVPTLNQTETRYGIAGTDLGFSFEHHGKLFFLFGDTSVRKGLKRDLNEDIISYADPLSATADDCIPLKVITDPADGGFHPPRIPGISNNTFEVPAGGISANDKMYVYFTNGSTDEKPMHRSYLGVSEDDGYSFKKVYFFSADKFINVTPQKVKTSEYPELPVHESSAVLLFGSGWYRQSNPYLSVVAENAIDKKNNLRYFSGINPQTKKPIWSSLESESAPLFKQPCIGELSTAYNSDIHKWIMLYNCDAPAKFRGINMRTADKPWGPWSKTQIIFNPVRDGAYTKFMHKGYTDIQDKQDDLSDEGQEDEWGGEYGPYMIPSLFTSNGKEATISYTMSIHNPYQTLLMKTRLRIE